MVKVDNFNNLGRKFGGDQEMIEEDIESERVSHKS